MRTLSDVPSHFAAWNMENKIHLTASDETSRSERTNFLLKVNKSRSMSSIPHGSSGHCQKSMQSNTHAQTYAQCAILRNPICPLPNVQIYSIKIHFKENWFSSLTFLRFSPQSLSVDNLRFLLWEVSCFKAEILRHDFEERKSKQKKEDSSSF